MRYWRSCHQVVRGVHGCVCHSVWKVVSAYPFLLFISLPCCLLSSSSSSPSGCFFLLSHTNVYSFLGQNSSGLFHWVLSILAFKFISDTTAKSQEAGRVFPADSPLLNWCSWRKHRLPLQCYQGLTTCPPGEVLEVSLVSDSG